MQFLLSEIIISPCKCENKPVRSPTTRLLPRASPPGPPPMFRPAPIRGPKAALKPLPCLGSPHQNYPSYAPDRQYHYATPHITHLKFDKLSGDFGSRKVS